VKTDDPIISLSPELVSQLRQVNEVLTNILSLIDEYEQSKAEDTELKMTDKDWIVD
jgi:hypothetical protein